MIDLQRFWNQLYSAPVWISWRPRHLNQIADPAANQSMDSNSDFTIWADPLPDPDTLKNTKIIGFSDGGLRKNVNKAAVGWVIVAVTEEGIWQVGKGGKFIKCGDAGSFGVEAVALETLVDSLNYLTLIDNGVRDNSWMVSSLNFSVEYEAEVRKCGS